MQAYSEQIRGRHQAEKKKKTKAHGETHPKQIKSTMDFVTAMCRIL